MNIIKKDLVLDIQRVLELHKIDSLYFAQSLGQVLDHLKDQCLSNSYEWMTANMVASYAIRHKVNITLKNLVEELEKRQEKPFNYNDMDCNLWGRHTVIQKPCLNCDSFISKMDWMPKAEGICERCKGTKIDPEYKDDSYVVYYDNHGNSLIYILVENSSGFNLHIREAKYNLSRRSMAALFNQFLTASSIGRYDSNFEYLRYHDKRDKGFIFSMSFHAEREGQESYLFDAESTSKAPYALTTVSEHFPTVFRD